MINTITPEFLKEASDSARRAVRDGKVKMPETDWLEVFSRCLLPPAGAELLMCDKVVWFDDDGYHEKAVDIYKREW